MRKPITKSELLELAGKNVIVKLIDIRSLEEYEKNHVPGAINIPAEEAQNQAHSFSKDDFIVCICNHGKERSQQAAEQLYNAGLVNTYYLEAGTAGWFA